MATSVEFFKFIDGQRDPAIVLTIDGGATPDTAMQAAKTAAASVQAQRGAVGFRIVEGNGSVVTTKVFGLYS